MASVLRCSHLNRALYFLEDSVIDKYTISLPVFDNCLSATGLRKVTYGSDEAEKAALEQFARYFKNEMHYDSIQYEAERHGSKTIGYLFTTSAMDICTEEHSEMPTRCVGGCVFRDVNGNWVLCWVWIHPFFRKTGVLSRQWQTLNDELGSFSIEKPLSASMDKFLQKQSSQHQLVRIDSL